MTFKIYVILLVGLMFTGSLRAESEPSKENYKLLKNHVQNAPTAVNFFSFYCPACYRFEEEIKIYDQISKILPSNEKLVSNHVSGMGPLGKELTRAWAVAIELGVTEQVKGRLYDGIQKSRSINSAEDIRRIFISSGVSASSYDTAWNSFSVKAHLLRQEQMVDAFGVTSIPALYIKGRYKLNPSTFDHSSTESFIQDYIKTLTYLLKSENN